MLLIAANKYQVNDLKAFAAGILINYTSVENSPEVCVLAKLHNCKELQGKMLMLMAENFDKIKGSDGWKAIESGHRDIWKDVKALIR